MKAWMKAWMKGMADIVDFSVRDEVDNCVDFCEEKISNFFKKTSTNNLTSSIPPIPCSFQPPFFPSAQSSPPFLSPLNPHPSSFFLFFSPSSTNSSFHPGPPFSMFQAS